MEEKLLELLKDKKDVCITKLFELMPEIKGEFCYYLPFKEEYNQKIYIINMVTEDFIHTLDKLTRIEEKINFKAVPTWIFLVDNAPIYQDKVFSARYIKSKKECWMPVTIELAK